MLRKNSFQLINNNNNIINEKEKKLIRQYRKNFFVCGIHLDINEADYKLLSIHLMSL